MEGNFYQSTRETILQKHRQRVEEANTARDEELIALEKLRPYWEALPTTNNSVPVLPPSRSTNRVAKKINAGAAASKGLQRSDFPEKVRIIVKEEFSGGNKIMQPMVFDKLVARFPEELAKSNENNIRSRISKALKRLGKNKVLDLVGKSNALGNALIFRKPIQNETNGHLPNFDTKEVAQETEKTTEDVKETI